MKYYEALQVEQRLVPLLPVIARLDGNRFSKFTKHLEKPFDEGMCTLMQETTRHMVETFNALLGYTQSDEISLVWEMPHFNSELPFGGRIQKMISILSGSCASFFNAEKVYYLGDRTAFDTPIFDCRIWNVPNREEAANTILWRELDATRNSITMAAQSVYSHKQLDGKNGKQKQEMLFQKNINWNDYPCHFKRGSYFQRKTVLRSFTMEEMKRLPLLHEARMLHEARKNPLLKYERKVVVQIVMPAFIQVTNRKEVVFEGADPLTEKGKEKD